MISNKVYVQKIIILLISSLTIYAPQCGLGDSQKDDFCDSLINVVRKVGEKWVFVVAGDFNDYWKKTQKTMGSSMEVMVMELSRGKGKVSMSFVQLWTWQ